MPDITGNQNAATVISTDAITQTPETTSLNVNAIGDALNNGYSSPYVYSTDPNALASQWRSNGIPAGAEPNYDVVTVSASYAEAGQRFDWRVRISSDVIASQTGTDVLRPLADTGGMIFPYLPQITLSHTANYSQMDIPHMNYPFFAYKNSQVDEITINGKFTVQNKAEAAYWVACLHFLKSVTKSFFGTGAYLGNPPPICKLNGYGDYVFKEIPIIVKNFTVSMPNDVDYIQSGAAAGMNVNYESMAGSGITYVPVSSDISVTVQPVYSRADIKTFDLNAFSSGQNILTKNGSGWI